MHFISIWSVQKHSLQNNSQKPPHSKLEDTAH